MLFHSDDSDRFMPLVHASHFFFNKDVHALYLQVSPAQDFFGFFELQLLVIHDTLMLHLFNCERMAQRKNQMGKFALFQPCYHLPELGM